MTTLGFLGFGEAAFNIAAGLREAGLDGIRAYDKAWNVEGQAKLVLDRAADAKVALDHTMEDLIRKVDIVVCSISADAAIPVAKASVPFLSKSQIYVDLNSAGPDTKVAVDKIVSPQATFVDVAVMGAVPGNRHKVPMLAAGVGAQPLRDFLAPYGTNITVLDGPPGKASASKMFRSIFMKGFMMLLLETVVAGRTFALEDDILTSIGKSLNAKDFNAYASDILCRGVIHSARREHEMDEVIATLESIDVDATMSEATKAKLNWCTRHALREHFGGVAPKDYHEIFAALQA